MIDLKVDVRRSIGIAEPAPIAVSVFVPDQAHLPPRPVVVFAGPGGFYTRYYYDLRLPGHEDYSQASHHTQRGLRAHMHNFASTRAVLWDRMAAWSLQVPTRAVHQRTLRRGMQ